MGDWYHRIDSILILKLEIKKRIFMVVISMHASVQWK